MMDDVLVKPNFIGIGAARSGTTSLYNWLKVHPQVYMSPIKETNYFSHLKPNFTGPGDDKALNAPIERKSDGTFVERHAAIVTSWQDYLALFAGSQGFLARGEISPSYLYYPNTAERIKEKLPQCKIIIILRDPIERAFSNYKVLFISGREQLDFESALEKGECRVERGWEHFWDLKGLGMYYAQVKRYLDTFSRNQIGIWLYEDMRSNPSKFYREVCQFIGVDDSFEPDFAAYNPSMSGVGTLNRFLRKHRRVTGILKKLIPRPIISFTSWIDDRFLAKRLMMKPDTRRYLLDYYREDILKLQELLPQLDVMQWIDRNEEMLGNEK